MPEHGKPDRWNSLLEDLGVPVSEPKPPEPAPEAAESATPPPAARSQPISMLRPEKPKAAPKPKPAPPAKSPSYWSRIAGALGLEVAAEPEPLAPEPPPARAEEPAPERAEESHREPPHREPPQQGPRRAPESAREAELPPREFGRTGRSERPDREGRPSREDRPPREDRTKREGSPRREERQHQDRPGFGERPRFGEPTPRSSLDDMFGAKPADLDVFGLGGEEAETPRVREPGGTAGRGESEEGGPVIDYDLPEGTGSDLSLGPAEPREFGAPREEGGERDGQRRRRRRRGRGRRGSGAESREGAPPRHEVDIEPAGEDADFDFDRDAELDLDADLGEERVAPPERPERGPRAGLDAESDRYPPSAHPPHAERPPRDRDDDRGGRPRRRRRGGRDRDESAAPRPARYGGKDEESPRFGPPRDQRASAAHAGAQDLDEDLDDDLSADSDELEADAGGDLPTHRKIPTWDEAVGILIEANMASRGPDRDRDRDRGRHRGRGRR